MKKASDLFIECLEEEGVEYIFGVPGEENLDLGLYAGTASHNSACDLATIGGIPTVAPETS